MIALLTDFEYGDGLGVVKGVIKSVNPKAEIVDLYNHVESYNVRSADANAVVGDKITIKYSN